MINNQLYLIYDKIYKLRFYNYFENKYSIFDI